MNQPQSARYTLRVERQLKERLIGAAVLFAIAVILVPEMFSGPKPRPTESESVPATRSGAASEASTDQMKTWRVNLQDAPVAAESSSVSAPAVEQPAPAPRAEQESSSANASVASASAQTSAASSSARSTASVASASSASSAKSATSVAASPSSARSSAASKPAEVRPPDAGGKWQVQVGSFGAETKAKQIAAQLKSQGQPAAVSAVQASGKTLYRVRVTAGTSREAAQAVLKKLQAAYPGASLVAPEK